MSDPQKELYRALYMISHRRTGSGFEEMAAGYLAGKGYRILERNYYTRAGELDILARSPEQVLVAVEVKYRRTDRFGDPAEAVDHQKKRHMARAFSLYLASHPQEGDVRFDVIAITGGKICHIENAFAWNG